MNIDLKPYDRESAEEAFSVLFTKGIDGDDGLKEVPSAALQLLVSGLEYTSWGMLGKDGDVLKKAQYICERLRDQQKMREWDRKADLAAENRG